MDNKHKKVRTSQSIESSIWEEVVKKFSEATEIGIIKRLFNSLVTSQERESIARRLAVISLLRQGLSYSKIGELLWVSPVTISTIKKSIGKEGYRSYHETHRGASGVGNAALAVPQKKDSAFVDWLDHIAFIMENSPKISGPRWRFLTYNRTLPKKYRKK